MVDLNSYIPMIDAILSAANPDQATPKRIRKALQELFAVDLDSRRKEINKIIVERFQESQNHPKKLITISELLKEDRSIAQRLIKGSSKKRNKSGNNGTSLKKKRRSESAGGFNKTKVLLAEPLRELLGETESTRTQVVKSIWDYIKRNNLQNPSDRREILCDNRMKPIFGEKVTMFSMNKALAKYIHNVPESSTAALPTPAPGVTKLASSPTIKNEFQNSIEHSQASDHSTNNSDSDCGAGNPSSGHEASSNEQE